MAQIATTREQSKKLQELGISVDTADMFYPLDSSFPEVCDSGDNLQVDYPAWSLGALIEILPEIIRCDIFNVYYYLTIDKDGVRYSNRMEDEENVYECYGELIECCVDMVETLVTEGYIKV